MADDFYAVLGVGEGATHTQIKAAYRRLARQFHPDKNPGDEDAATRFKDAAEAYRVLGDKDLRAQYDGHRKGPGRGAAAVAGAGEVFDEIFGTRRRPEQRPRPSSTREPTPPPRKPSRGSERGRDLKYTLEISLEESALGSTRTISVPGTDRCDRCAGTGARPGTAPIICQMCSGSGTVREQHGFFDKSTRCRQCGGSGRFNPETCRSCAGTGRMEVDRELEVDVPAGVTTGQRLKLSGHGLEGEGGAAPGDLFVVVEVAPHPLYTRDGDDLVVEVPVTFAQAALGAQVEVPTFDGRVRMRIPPGSQSGRIFRLKGRGFPSADRKSTGDQRVRIVVETPAELSTEQRELLERFAELEAQRGLPERIEAFRRQLRDMYRS